MKTTRTAKRQLSPDVLRKPAPVKPPPQEKAKTETAKPVPSASHPWRSAGVGAGCDWRGTTTTPFDMMVLNDLDRFHLVGDVIDRVRSLGDGAAYAKQFIRDKLIEYRN